MREVGSKLKRNTWGTSLSSENGTEQFLVHGTFTSVSMVKFLASNFQRLSHSKPCSITKQLRMVEGG